MSNVTELRPITILCALLALMPPYSFEKKALIVSKPYKCYAVFLNALMLSGYCYSLYGKLVKDIFHDYLETLKVIEHLTNIFLNVTNVSAVTLSVFYNSQHLQNILNGLSAFDSFTAVDSGVGRIRVWLFLAMLHLIVVGFLLVDTIQWLSFVHFQMVKYYLPRNVFMYNFCIVVNLMIILTIQIEKRFRTLNKILAETAEEDLNRLEAGKHMTALQDVNHQISRDKNVDLKAIGKLHNYLCQVVDDFNHTYGFIILITVIFTITIIVNYTGLLMAFTVFRIKLDVSTDKINLLYVSFFWILGAMLQVSILATRCHTLAEEANQLTEISYDCLNKIPDYLNTDRARELREELTIIAKQSLQRRPRISAAGFFEVNHDMCGFILSTVTSYIIVTIQFLAKEKERY